MTKVQIRIEAVCVSVDTNVFMKGKNILFLSPGIGLHKLVFLVLIRQPVED